MVGINIPHVRRKSCTRIRLGLYVSRRVESLCFLDNQGITRIRHYSIDANKK